MKRAPAFLAFLLSSLIASALPVSADALPPAEVSNLLVSQAGGNVVLSWDPVTTSHSGGPESVTGYRVYRGDLPSFIPDRIGGSNLVGTPGGAGFTDIGAANGGGSYFYLISAVDASANEGNTRSSKVLTPPLLSIDMSGSTAGLTWSSAAPPGSVGGYLLMWGQSSGDYTASQNAGASLSYDVTSLTGGNPWYFVVAAYDTQGNLSALSNEVTGSIVSAGPTEVCGRISTATTWSAAGSPYIVTCDVSVYADGPFNLVPPPPAILTIEAGVEVRFNTNTALLIGSGSNPGQLIASGTSSAPILFTGNQTFPQAGQWRGIFFSDGADDASILEHAIVQYAGASAGAGLTLTSAAPILRDVAVRQSLGYGINLANGSAPTIQRAIIEDVTLNGVRVDNASPVITDSVINRAGGSGLSFTGPNSAVIQGNTIDHGIFMDTAGGNPVITGNTLARFAEVTSRLGAGDVAELYALNTITGAGPTGRLEVMGETVDESGIWPGPGYPFVVLGALITVAGDLASGPTLTIQPGAVIQFGTNLYLRVGSGANRGALVAVGTAGQPILFTTSNVSPAPGQWGGVYFDDGADDAISRIEYATVEYAGVTNSAGIRSNSSSPIIRNCTVRHSSVYGLYLQSSGATVESCLVTSTASNGIRVDLGGSPLVKGSTVTAPTGPGIFVSGSNSARFENNVSANTIFFDNAGGDPVLTGNTFSNLDAFPIRVGADDVGELLGGNTLQGGSAAGRIEVMGETVDNDATWPANAFPYQIIGSVTVAGTTTQPATLTISPGAVLRFNAGIGLYIGTLSLKGALVAVGTSGQPIRFTTSNAVPAPGQWASVYFDAESVDASSVLEQCIVEYGGASDLGNVRAANSAPTIRSCTIRNGSGRGIYGTSGASPVVQGNTLSGNAGFDIELTGASNATVTGNTVATSIFFNTAAGTHSVTGNTFNNYNDAARNLRVGAHALNGLGSNVFNGTGASSRVEILGETIAADTTCAMLPVPYVVLQDITVANSATQSATLTIQPGVQIRFNAATGLYIGTTTLRGALVAAGTPAQPIVFTTSNATPAAGQWKAIYFDNESVDAVSVLENCVVEYGGATELADVRLVNSSPTIRSCTIRNSSGRGIYGTTGASPLVQGNTLSGNAAFDVELAGTSNATITGNTLSASVFFPSAAGTHSVTGNTFNNYNDAARNLRVGAHALGGLGGNVFNGTGANSRVEILGETIAADMIWPGLPVAYVVLQDIIVANSATQSATLTIQPGAQIRFNAATGLYIGTTTLRGALVAAGTPAQPIVFTTSNATPAAGQWKAIYFDTESVDAVSLLENCVVEYGGATELADVRLVNSSPTIRSCTIRNSSGRGIYGTTGASPLVQGNTLSGNAGFDVELAGTSNATVTGNTLSASVFFPSAAGTHSVTGNTFNNYNNAARNLRVGAHALPGLGSNVFNGTGASSRVEVLGESVLADATWPGIPVPYQMLGDITVANSATQSATLTIQPGAQLRFDASVGLFIGTTTTKGALVAVGTPAQPIVFTSSNATPAPGQWEGIYFDTESVDAVSRLEYCTVEYAGQTYTADVRLVTSAPTIRSCTIRNSSSRGIYVTGSQSPTIQANQFSGNTDYDVRFDGGSPSLLGNTFTHAAIFEAATGAPLVQGNIFDAYVAPFLLRLGADSVTTLTGNTFNGVNATSRIEVIGETLAGNNQWADPGIDYSVITTSVTVAGTATVPGRLRIDPGVTIRFAPSTRLIVASGTTQGELIAQGTAADPILLTTANASPAAGQWQGVILNNGTTFSTVLEYVTIEYAGQGSLAGLHLLRADPDVRHVIVRNALGVGLLADESSPLLDDVTIQATGSNGISVVGTSSERTPVINNCQVLAPTGFGIVTTGTVTATITSSVIDNSIQFGSAAGRPVVQGNTLNNYDAFPLRIGADSIFALTGNVFSGTGANSRIEILGETVPDSGTWQNLGLPYQVVSGVVAVAGTSTVPSTLTIAPGVTVRFASATRLTVATTSLQGSLIAVGTPAQPITFTTASASPLPGQWRGLLFDSLTVDATARLEHCVVEYAGQTENANVFVSNAAPVIEHCILRRGSGAGLLMTSAAPRARFNSLVDNGTYGAQLQSTSTPTLQHNIITGNTSGGINQTGTNIADVRFNWYGSATGPGGSGPGTGQSVAANLAFDPWLGAPFTDVNYVRDLFPSTRTFAPGSFSRFTGQIAQSSSWTLTILDAGNVVVRTIAGSGDTLSTTWDGKDNSAVNQVDGVYRYQLDATGTAPAAPLIGRLTLDATFAVAEVNAPAHLQTVGIGTVIPVSGSALGGNFTNYQLQFGAGLFPTTFTNITTSSSQVNNASLGSWNTVLQTSGLYTVRLLVNNNLTEQTVVNVGTFVLAVNSLTLDRAAFSPNDDGSLDEVTASSTLSTDAGWTIDVVRVSSSSVVRSFSGFGRNVSQSWNGLLPDEVTVAPEGDYRFDLTATLGGTNVIRSSATTALDVTPPAAALLAPADGAEVFTTVGITGDAYDPDNHFQSYLLEFGVGAVPLSYTSIQAAQLTPVTGGSLGSWVTNNFEATEPIPNGGYTIRLTVNDQAGNLSRVSRLVNIDNLVLGAVSSSSNLLDSSLGEAAAIQFSINKPATVSLKIYPETTGESGAIQKQFSGSFPAGSHVLNWDATNAAGLAVPDEAYVYVLEADAGGGRTDKFSPSGGQVGGSGSGTVDAAYNPYTNDFWTMVYSNSSPSRVTMQVTPTGQPVFDVFTLEPHLGGNFTIVWDGRKPAGDIVTAAGSVYFPPPTTLRPNFIITKGNKPRTSGLLSDPYRLFMSYSHVSRFSFMLERDATVTITLLPPGVSSPSDPSGRQVLAATPMVAGAYEVLFDPVDPLVADEDTFLFGSEGPYTFAIQSVNPVTGATSLSRGVVTMFK